MIAQLVAAAAVGATFTSAFPAPAAPPTTSLPSPLPSATAEIARAIDGGRLEQARIMIAAARVADNPDAGLDRLTADLDLASGQHAAALAAYERLIVAGDTSAAVAERGAVAALCLGDAARAQILADQAVAQSGASWRAWNARGAIADFARDFATADKSYGEALARAKDRPEVLNNLGWSLVMRGEWHRAIDYLQRAVRHGQSGRAINNLELVQAAIAADLPERLPAETDNHWAARLNDAGVAARLRGDEARAIAAFARALHTRPIWYGRAWQNLQLATRAQ